MKENRRVPVLGRVVDVFGDLWDITEVRETKHGFDLLFGARTNSSGGARKRTLIASQELADFWRRHRIDQKSVRYDLPVGIRTISRVRRDMGFHYSRDVAEFWASHVDELGTLDSRVFGAQYGVGRCHVLGMRRELTGGTRGDWWRAPEKLALIQSKMLAKDVGEKLGITVGEVYRFRRVLRAEAREGAAVPAQIPQKPDTTEVSIS